MASGTVMEVLLGIYLGLLAGIFPAFVAFSIGFTFKYFTSVTVPGLGVVVLGGALAGVSGGLMGLIDSEIAESWTGVTAVLVILMSCLWAHGQGDKLGSATPRKLTLKTLREAKLSTDIAERVDSYGQIRIRPLGTIDDIEGYPPLPDDLREQLAGGSWKFPANLSIGDLERRLEERLSADHELAEVSVSIDRKGRAEVAAAPSSAGLSRRVPAGQRAVSIRTLLPTGLTRGDYVTILLSDGDVAGPVVSARSTGVSVPSDVAPESTDVSENGDASKGEDSAEPEESEPPVPKAPTTTGGEGQVTVAVSRDDARRILTSSFAPIVVHSRGKQREYEAIGILKGDGNRFQKLTLGEESSLVGKTIGDLQVRDTYGVAILAIHRPTERLIAPRGSTELFGGDVLLVVGKSDQVTSFEEVAT